MSDKRRWKKSTSLDKGDVFKTKYGREFTIGDYDSYSNRYECIFEDLTRWVGKKEIDNGTILHPEDRTVYSVGFLGKGEYTPQTHKEAYKKWINMFKRVYSKDPHYQERYYNVSIASEWLNFQNFAEWYYSLPYVEKGIKYELDKDLYYLDKDSENKEYSSSTCFLIPKILNMRVCRFRFNPKVTYDNGKYRYAVSCNGSRFELGRLFNEVNAKIISVLTNVAIIEGLVRDLKLPLILDTERIIGKCCRDISNEV